MCGTAMCFSNRDRKGIAAFLTGGALATRSQQDNSP
jgi:hypothetical protein